MTEGMRAFRAINSPDNISRRHQLAVVIVLGCSKARSCFPAGIKWELYIYTRHIIDHDKNTDGKKVEGTDGEALTRGNLMRVFMCSIAIVASPRRGLCYHEVTKLRAWPAHTGPVHVFRYHVSSIGRA